MSFVKKFMTQNSKKSLQSTTTAPSSSNSQSTSTSSLCCETTPGGETEKGVEKGTKKAAMINPDSVEEDLIDLFVLHANYQMKRDNLNQQFEKARRLEKKMNALKCGVTQLCQETEEINRVLSGAEEQFPLLLKEYMSRREELEEKLKSIVDRTKESEIKKREPIMYKKFAALKTIQDANHYLSLIQTKQKTLMHLELLALRKHASFQQCAAKAAQKATTSDRSRLKPPAVPKKPQKESLQSVYQELLKTFVQLTPLNPPPAPSTIPVENSTSETDNACFETDLFPVDNPTEHKEATVDTASQEVQLTLESEV